METNTTETCMDSMEDDPLASQKSKRQPFFACYLLCSLSSRYKGCTYIGFTVNPCRRIRQHNGEITSGAHKTKRKRPWEMILCIYGFPSQVSALQFEWAWQNPKMSLAVKEAAKGLKQLGGTAGKIRLAYTMLTLSEWKSLNITVNFLSTKYVGNTKGCPTLPSHMKVQICPVDELPCYTDNWLSDGEDDMEEEHCFGSDVSDPEEIVEGDKGTSHQKTSTDIKKRQEQECDQQPAKKCRRRGRTLKQLKSSIPADELGSKVAVPSLKKLSLSTVRADEETEGSDRLNSFFSNHDCLLQISDGENTDGASGSFLIPNTYSPVNFKQETSDGAKNNLSINFRTDCFLANDNEANKPKGISDDFSIKNKMIAAPDPVEYNFPSFQEYSPLCYISPLKTSEEASLSFTSPCKSTPTNHCTFLSPVASQGQVITILSTPRPVSRGVIDLTDSPAT